MSENEFQNVSTADLLGMLVVQSEAAGEWQCQQDEATNSEIRVMYQDTAQKHRDRASAIKAELIRRWEALV